MERERRVERVVDEQKETIDLLVKRIAELEAQIDDANSTINNMAADYRLLQQQLADLKTRHNVLLNDQLEIVKILTDAGIEHSGFKKQAPRVQMLAERSSGRSRQWIEEIKKRKDAEKRIAELEQAHNSRGSAVLAFSEKQTQMINELVAEKQAQRWRIAELEAQLAKAVAIVDYDAPDKLSQIGAEYADLVQHPTPSHVETIVCPNCNHFEQATVLHTVPWHSYVHDCSVCGYTIIESEWQRSEDYIKDYAEGCKP